jgi:hypothetical protein
VEGLRSGLLTQRDHEHTTTNFCPTWDMNLATEHGEKWWLLESLFQCSRMHGDHEPWRLLSRPAGTPSSAASGGEGGSSASSAPTSGCSRQVPSGGVPRRQAWIFRECAMTIPSPGRRRPGCGRAINAERSPSLPPIRWERVAAGRVRAGSCMASHRVYDCSGIMNTPRQIFVPPGTWNCTPGLAVDGGSRWASSRACAYVGPMNELGRVAVSPPRRVLDCGSAFKSRVSGRPLTTRGLIALTSRRI